MSREIESKDCSCGGVLKRTVVSKTISLAGRRVKVSRIPATQCPACGEIFLDGSTLIKLEADLLKQDQAVPI